MSAATAEHAIVVGVDGSDLSLHAVAWGAREAELRNRPLLLVHAYVWPLLNIPSTFAGIGPADGLREHAEGILDDAVQAARAVAPGIDVRTHSRTSFPLQLLIEMSRQAVYVVVGSRGLGVFESLVAGSTTIDLMAHAYAPVVITYGLERRDDGAPILLGTDGSAANSSAIGVAFDAAATHERSLVAVHVVPAGDRDTGGRDGDAAQPTSSAGGELVGHAMAGWMERYPNVTVKQEVVTGHPGGVLIERSQSAFLTVVGSRGRGGFKGMLLGSVSQALAHHTQSPLIVVPPGAGAEADSEAGQPS